MNGLIAWTCAYCFAERLDPRVPPGGCCSGLCAERLEARHAAQDRAVRDAERRMLRPGAEAAAALLATVATSLELKKGIQ